MNVYAGTYTGPGKAEGISVFRMDQATGSLEHVQTMPVDNPSFLALDPHQRALYAANESGTAGNGSSAEGRGPGVSAFAIEEQTGKLSPLNRQPSHGEAPCYVSIAPSGRHVLVANYGSGTVAVFPIHDDRQLGEATDVVQHEGAGPNPRRQQGPHAHFIAPSPDGRFILSCDLGIDRIMLYRFHAASGTLEPNDLPYAQVSSGAGPRHLAFHPNRRFVYVNNEIDSTLSVFAYDETRGALLIQQTRSTLPQDFSGNNSTAQVVVHPTGRFVYVSNRGHNSIAMFAIDPDTGRVRTIGHEPTQGANPRNFNIDPSGTFLLAANQNTDRIVTFRIDGATGKLASTGHVTETPAPVCLVFGR